MSERDKPLVVVADDDITARMLAREFLEQSGFSVREAKNGREAIECVAEERPDAVMLDVMMPETDGYEACRVIREMPGNQNLPILMMTTLDNAESINAAYTAGASEFTVKPVNWTIEVYRLKNMLRLSAAVKQVELAHQEWERTFNALDELVIIYDQDMNVIQANNAAIAAAHNPTSVVQGKTCKDLFRSMEDECPDCPIRSGLTSREKLTKEWESDCFGGTFLVSVFPVFDEEDQVARVVCLAKDITERKRLDEELRCAQKMDAIGTLSGGLAHDFNNLLQIIFGHAEIGMRELPEDTEMHHNLETIRNAARRGAKVTRQLMSVSRNVESHPQPMLLNDTVNEVVRLLESTFPKMISMDLHLDEKLSLINADPAQMEQMLMNLAVNSRYAMPDGGGLYFETRNTVLDHSYCRMHPNVTEGKYVSLSVTDTGCGMDADTRERIFEPFFTTRPVDQGTGLGLAMVYGIVQKHNGHIQCYSEIGKGSTFKIYLPAVLDESKVFRETSVVEPLSVGGDEVILLVDDEPAIRNLAKKMLLHAGYRVLLASNGQEALDILEAEGALIDLVVMDLNMPVMGGLECLDRLRSQGSNIPVLLSSGFALNEDSRKRLNDSVHYLNKPYHSYELLKEIRKMA